MSRPRAAGLALAGAVLTACSVFWALRGDQTRDVPAHLAVWTVAFAAYLGALRLARGLSARGLGACLGAAVLWRVLLIPAPPLLSDDVHRSVWEGRIQRHGGNPYAWEDRPEAAKWAALRDGVWEGINHKSYTAIYPPLWQLTARAVVAVRDSVAAMKAFLVLCEALALATLSGALRRRGLPRERLLVWAFSPLALVEIAGSGHNDALGLLALAAALAALDASRPLASALAAAAGAGAKLLPGLVALAWARRYRPLDALAAAALGALLVAPYADAGGGLLRSLGQYARHWRFNETGFAALEAVAGSGEASAALAVGALAVLAAALAVRRAEPAGAALAVIAAWLLLAPNVLPWYALWLLPPLVLRDAPAALLFTGTAGLAYLVYPGWLAGGPWTVGWDVRALEYGPCLVLAAREAVRHVRRCRIAAPGAP